MCLSTIQVAKHLQMELSAVEEQVLDSADYMSILEEWLDKDSTSRALIFYYQEAEYLPFEDCGRHMAGAKGQMVSQVWS